jgi:hypothetical protein
MTWKTKVSKANVLLFQLQASVHGIKEKGSGLLPTPVVSDHLHNQSESIENWTKRSKEKKKQGINLHFALRHHVQMYPTPTTMDHIDRKGMRPSRAATNRKTGYLSEMIKMFPTPRARDYFPPVNPNQVQMNEQGWTSTRKKTGVRYGATLPDVMNKIAIEMYPTPVSRDYKDAAYNITWKESRDQKSSLPRQVLKDNKPGGKLNPNFVEFLMGFPMNWTKIDPTE